MTCFPRGWDFWPMRAMRAHLAAWLFGLAYTCMPPHPYKTAMIATMAEHGRQWWRMWRAEGNS